MTAHRKPATPVEPTEIVEFVVHGALAPRLIDWLNGQGMDVYDFPHEPDALRCLMVTPGEDLMRSVGLGPKNPTSI